MTESVDDFLRRETSSGAVESEGTFSLNVVAAARKFSEFGQAARSLWTLKLGQGFQLLGCRELHFIESAGRWTFRGVAPGRALDRNRLLSSLGVAGLRSEREAEDLLALGMGALAAVEGPDRLKGACWVSDQIYPIFGVERELQIDLAADEVALILDFAEGRAPKLPFDEWGRRFCYAPMAIATCGTDPNKLSYLNDPHSAKYLAEDGLFWLEYLGQGIDHATLRLNPTGNPRSSLGDPIPVLKLPQTAQLGWLGVCPGRADSIIVMARDGLAGKSQLLPTIGGCLLDPVSLDNFPEGFKIVVAADDCPTDLGHNKLREGFELTRLVEDCRPVLLHAIELMKDSLAKERTVVDKPVTPLAADVPPGCLSALSMVALPFVWIEPISGFLCLLFLGGPPGVYFWLSRRTRNKEFGELKQTAGTLLQARQEEIVNQITPASSEDRAGDPGPL